MPRILLADDHDLVRDTICAYLENVGGFDVASAANLGDALNFLRESGAVDLCLLDYNMPGMDGLNGLTRVATLHPTTKFALISGEVSGLVAAKAMKAGASGYLPKTLAAQTMVHAVRLILSGDRYFPYGLGDSEKLNTETHSDYRELSKREAEVLRALSQGLSNKEIARLLGVQEVTVKLHLKNVFKKLDVTNRTSAVLLARSEGFE